jgi:hypothetical protein
MERPSLEVAIELTDSRSEGACPLRYVAPTYQNNVVSDDD